MTLLHQAAQKAVEAPLHSNHRADLRYVLKTLERALPAHKKDGLRGDIEAAINGMRYIIQRTEEAAIQQKPEPVAWMWQYIGRDPMGCQIKPCARSLHEMNPHKPPYPDSWKPLHPLYASPALQQQEVPSEPVAFEAWAARTLGISNFDRTEDGDYLNPDTDDLWRCWQEAADSPSTTRQQEAGSEWRLVPVEPTEEMKAKCTDGMSPGRAELWWNDVFAPAYRAMLAAAPSTPENAGGVPGTSNDQQEQPR